MKSLIRIGIALLCVMLGTAAGRSASIGAVVTGTITDQTGAVIVSADVLLLNLASGREVKTKTDSSGKYELTELPDGSYQLSINSHGFAVAARVITLHRSARYQDDFSLVPGVIESSTTVTAGKGNVRVAIDTPQMLSVTNQSDIEERRPISASRALE